jgi:hypothetical protein
VRPLKTIYLTRIGLAVVAAALSTAITIAFGERGINTFLNGITIALLIYLITYYVFKAKYRTQVEKQSKIMSMGIGVYFFTWLVVWVLMYTIAISLGLATVPA